MADDENIFAQIWREQRLSCLDRRTLGAYLLGTLSPGWRDYVEFHLRVLECPYCQSNLDDLSEEAARGPDGADRPKRLFESSVGHLPRG